jgi:hypothetical protein
VTAEKRMEHKVAERPIVSVTNNDIAIVKMDGECMKLAINTCVRLISQIIKKVLMCLFFIRLCFIA